MNKYFYLLLLLCLTSFSAVFAQNADQLFYEQYALQFQYQASSFVVDTPASPTDPQRAFLLWSSNINATPTRNGLSLDQFDASGNFLSSRAVPEKSVPLEYLQPKKIIRSKLVNGYYLLGYVIKSPNLINGFNVYSTPVVIRLDSRLAPVWVEKLHFSVVNTTNAQSLIEYNDIVESANGEIIIAGRYSTSPGSGTQTNVLVTRLKNSGSVLWSYNYPNGISCNANALSLTEATDGTISLTGYVENCSSPFSGPRQVLYMSLKPSGSPILGFIYTNSIASSGDKIVKRTNIAGNDAFFISGYIDIPLATGATNRQILLLDVTQGGGIISQFHIGDAGAEEANDLVIKDLGNQTYYLYLTGYTSSYYTQVKREVYYLQLKYSPGVLNLVEFSTFPQTASYNARTGIEIRSAGKERFAILANADYNVVAGAPASVLTNVLVRDLADISNQCVKSHNPPVVKYQLGPKQLNIQPVALPFKPFQEVWQDWDRIISRPLCGQFFIDAGNAVISGIIQSLQAPATAAVLQKEAAVQQAAGVHIYPNPTANSVYVEYNKLLPGKVIVNVYSSDMRLIGRYDMTGNVRRSIPLNGLSSGLYFIQVETRDRKEIFKVWKQ